MDAGPLTLTGPSGSGLSSVALADSNGAYSLTFAGQFATISGEMLPGNYTLAGAGGRDVGQFTATVMLPTLLTGSSLPAVINRSSGLTVTWTGGNPTDQVVISGQAITMGNGSATGANFACYTTAAAGTFTVPASILSQLPAVSPQATPGAGASSGSFSVGWITAPGGSNAFSAPLTGGGTISNATFTGSTRAAVSIAYQ